MSMYNYLAGGVISYADPHEFLVRFEKSGDKFELSLRVGYCLTRNGYEVGRHCCGSNYIVSNWEGLIGMDAGEFWRERVTQEWWKMEAVNNART